MRKNYFSCFNSIACLYKEVNDDTRIDSNINEVNSKVYDSDIITE